MSRRKSLEDWARYYAKMDQRDPRTIHEILSPTDAGILLFRTSNIGCLTHITRYVSQHVASYHDGLYITAFAECGVMGYGGDRRNRRSVGHMLVRDPETETFGCQACIERAERFDLPTYNLIPDTGCSATGGQRFRPSGGVRLDALPPPAVKTLDNTGPDD